MPSSPKSVVTSVAQAGAQDVVESVVDGASFIAVVLAMWCGGGRCRLQKM